MDVKQPSAWRRKTVNRTCGFTKQLSRCESLNSPGSRPQGVELAPQRVQVDPSLVPHAETMDRQAEDVFLAVDLQASLEAFARPPDAPRHCGVGHNRAHFRVDLERQSVDCAGLHELAN